ncbi:TonB-dependent receptor [Sphingomonas colocasiae]|uniref:TonB-dependent receptor n=2 Tax=Sphingomonas colocasiae TaxID=1848973 RepID=A0ABS7PZZ2_9SPHN|nr:TonB-dependent receptor [Sphingomonas colocasiae]
MLLEGTGMTARWQAGGIYVISASRFGAADRDDDIIVTARKRAERPIDIPVALTSIGGRAMERRGGRSVAEILQEAPGVGVYDQGNGLSKIMIRGVSTSLGANENGYYLDDLPFTGVTVPLSPDVRAWDLDRIEVLRGPQGTLFGEGSMGGTIRILTKGADLDVWEAKAAGFMSGTHGGGANGGIKGALNAPIIPGILAVRVAATHERFDGWLDDDAAGTRNLNGQRFDTVRVRLRFDPVARLSITGSYWFYQGRFPTGGSLGTDNGQQSRSSVLRTTPRHRLYNGAARYDFGGAELFYGYSHSDYRLPQNGLLLGGAISAVIGIKVDSHELRLASAGGGPLQWTVGGYLRDADRNDNLDFALFGIDNVDSTRSRARAVFGEATYTPGGAPIDITAGLRYYEEDLGGYEVNSGIVTHDQGDTYRSVNPRVSIAWHPRPDATIYASAAKGFRAGQLQPTTSLALGKQFGIDLPPALGQDSIWTYELGGKADLFDHMLTIEGAIYYSDWKDVTVRIPIAATGFNGLINSKGIRSKGAELSVILRPMNGLTLSANGGYVDATYSGAVAGTGIIKGAIADDVASFTASASIDYGAQIADGVFGTARIGWQHSSPRSFVAFPGYLPGDTIDRIDARVGLDFDRVSVALFADNLTNENGATSYRLVQTIASGGTDISAFRPRPRTIGIEASLRFGGRP